ncbi:MAG: hypothetical protein ACREBR_01515 [bacterium]
MTAGCQQGIDSDDDDSTPYLSGAKGDDSASPMSEDHCYDDSTPYLSGVKGDDSASPVAGEDLCDDDCTTPMGVKGGESRTALLMRELKDDDREKAIWRQVLTRKFKITFGELTVTPE